MKKGRCYVAVAFERVEGPVPGWGLGIPYLRGACTSLTDAGTLEVSAVSLGRTHGGAWYAYSVAEGWFPVAPLPLLPDLSEQTSGSSLGGGASG